MNTTRTRIALAGALTGTRLAVIAGTLIAGAALMPAGSAFAGEMTGNGTLKGVNPNASLCAYSGLNDFMQGQTTSRTQTPKDAAPGSAAHGWDVGEPGDPLILTCNKNGPVGG